MPRRYRCQPSLALGEALRIAKEANPALSPLAIATIERRVVTPLKPGLHRAPLWPLGLLQEATAAPVEIRSGADDESEMGLWSHVHQPQREQFLGPDRRVPAERLEASHVYAT